MERYRPKVGVLGGYYSPAETPVGEASPTTVHPKSSSRRRRSPPIRTAASESALDQPFLFLGCKLLLYSNVSNLLLPGFVRVELGDPATGRPGDGCDAAQARGDAYLLEPPDPLAQVEAS